MTYPMEAEQLVKHYTGRGGDVQAVKGVDLHVRRGRLADPAVGVSAAPDLVGDDER